MEEKVEKKQFLHISVFNKKYLFSFGKICDPVAAFLFWKKNQSFYTCTNNLNNVIYWTKWIIKILQYKSGKWLIEP